LLGLAWATILLSLRPEVLFLSWLAFAPFLQESAAESSVGHPMLLACYVAPPLVLALWTITRPARRLAPGFVDALPLLYFLYVLTLLTLSGEASSTSLRSIYLTVGVGIILYYFFAFGPVGSLTWQNITAVLLGVAALVGVMSVMDALTGWNLWQDTGWREGLPRAVATLGNPAVLGTFIGMGVVLALAVLVWGGPERLRTLAITTIVLGLPGIFVTYTRAPILATIVIGVLVLAGRPHTRLIALCSLIVAAVVVAASWDRISGSTLYRERVANESTIQTRVLIQDWSLELAAKRPVFGWGYGSFDRVKNSSSLSSGGIPHSYGASSTSHNTYLTYLVEYGGVGLVLILIPWLVITWRALKTALVGAELRWFLVGAIAAVSVYVINANTLDMRFFSFVPALPWLFLGLLRRHQGFARLAPSE
jgi:O-antigen ligase